MPPTARDVLTTPDLFARTFLKILDKEGRLVPLRYNIVQREYLHERGRRDLVLKARQMGISTVIQAELFRLAVIGTAITVTLAHEDQTTQRFRRMVDRFYKNMPAPYRPLRRYSNSRLATYPDFDSEAIIATAGNENTGRGGMATHIHGSEVAFWKDAEALMAGLMQGGNPSIVLESTPNGARGYFYQKCMEALDSHGKAGWNLIVIPWWVDPEYATPLDPGEVLDYTDEEQSLVAAHGLRPEQVKWRRAKQTELKGLFYQEYIEDARACFLLSGMGYFGDLGRAFTAPLRPTYDRLHLYVAGLDWGQANDYTVLSIVDLTTRQQVAVVRVNNQEWKEMRRRVIAACKTWHVRSIAVEMNSMGSTNFEALRDELSAASVRTALVPFVTSNDSKASVMGALHETLHAPDGLRLLDDPFEPAQKRELMAFAAYQLPSGVWQLRAPDDEHDDTVIATALAWYAGSRGLTDEQVQAIGDNRIDPTKLSPAMLESLRASGVDIRDLLKAVKP